MSLAIGVVGPADLLGRVEAAGKSAHGAKLLPLAYGHENEACELVLRHEDEVDAFLFTGVIPYTLAVEHHALHRPATFVSYTGATMLASLLELQRLGHDVTRVSVDTLPRDAVLETFSEARLPTAHVRVLAYHRGLTSQDFVAFHRHAFEAEGTLVAVTCLGSAHQALEGQIPVVRLAPSRNSIRDALVDLILITNGRVSTDAQVAVGLLELSEKDPQLARELRSLAPVVAPLSERMTLVVTTRGALEQASQGFTRLALLQRLAARHDRVHLAFGLGRTASEAKALAKRALNRLPAVGPIASIVAMNDDVDFVIGPLEPAVATEPAGAATPEDIALIARRVGLSRDTLLRLRELVEAGKPGVELTTRDVAGHLDIQERTARRILKRLERGGLAEHIASRQGGNGRPQLVYQVKLQSRASP